MRRSEPTALIRYILWGEHIGAAAACARELLEPLLPRFALAQPQHLFQLFDRQVIDSPAVRHWLFLPRDREHFALEEPAERHPFERHRSQGGQHRAFAAVLGWAVQPDLAVEPGSRQRAAHTELALLVDVD